VDGPILVTERSTVETTSPVWELLFSGFGSFAPETVATFV
jgi:hypothetical protein